MAWREWDILVPKLPKRKKEVQLLTELTITSMETSLEIYTRAISMTTSPKFEVALWTLSLYAPVALNDEVYIPFSECTQASTEHTVYITITTR